MSATLTMWCEVKYENQVGESYIGLFRNHDEAEKEGERLLKENPADYWTYRIEEL